MRVAITGASGLIGRALVESLRADAHEVTRLVRSEAAARAPDAVFWDPATDRIDAAHLEGQDAFVHLAGESIAGVWTDARKRQMRESRVRGTNLLTKTLLSLRQPPKVLFSGSAEDYYGNRPPGERLDESSKPGKGFLPDLVQAWERAAEAARPAVSRIVLLRTSLVLSREGGALAPMLPVFRMGLGGKLGDGRQVWSWITLEDEVAAIRHLLALDDANGPYNLTSPEPVTNQEFTVALARTLGRPSFMTVPAFALRMAVGEMADQLLLRGHRIYPTRLLDSGFQFRHPTLPEALQAVLG